MTDPIDLRFNNAISEARAAYESMHAQISTLKQNLLAANMRIDELIAQHKSNQPKTLVGVSTMKPTIEGLLDADKRYKHVVEPARVFWPNKPLTLSLDTPHKIVGSCKSIGLAPIQTAWQNQCWRWTYIHEIDVKRRKKLMTDVEVDQWKLDLKKLANAGNPDGASVILSAWTFNKGSNDNPDRYAVDVPCLGVDFDGISYKDGKFPDYRAELDAVHSYTSKRNLKFGIAEFGAGIDPKLDPKGELRIEWMSTYLKLFKEAGAEYVCLWEYSGDSATYLLQQPEIEFWSKQLT